MKTIVITLAAIGAPLLFGANLGMKIYGKNCVECHGDNGKDTSVSPKSIGGETGVLEKLLGYKNGTYGYGQKETMQMSLKTLKDDELKAVSAYVETLK
ncbi:c-type cytochrome [Sulfuricurvum sp.]|uniref:c-type cytochrome n=1 Tax=Sulfuricurvum sp. TaxID=2025608 RepID=UPI003C32EB1C